MNHKEQIETLKNLNNVCNLIKILQTPEKNGIHIEDNDLKAAKNTSQKLFHNLIQYYIKDYKGIWSK